MEDFKSQVCTSVEQSKRLLELGLKKETADMVYHYQKFSTGTMQWELRPHPPTLRHTTHLNVDKLNVFKHKKPDGSIMTGEEYFQELWGKDIPAWSLHRLIEMSLNLSYGVAYCYTAGSNMNVTYDEVIDMIEWAISKECFNKDYLEERK